MSLSCLALALGLSFASSALDQEPASNASLTSLERAAGWRLLFDGRTTAGWVGYGTDSFPAEGWDVQEGCLHKVPGARGGDVVFREPVGDFELEFEWKVAPGANSGVKYRVPPATGARAMLGPEYQVLDDSRQIESTDELQRAGALYALYPADGKQLAPQGEFNHSRIVARGARIEHWLNGVRVVACEVGSEDWERRKAASKFAEAAGFAAPARGHLGLQDHGGEVWYRNLRLREWPPPGRSVELYDGRSLAGWTEVGDARWTPEPRGILGEVGGGGQSFLVTERSFGDFVMEVELRPELPGNSGIQVRSHRRPNGRVFGYQVEIDSSKRAWSAGIYDEARRGWLNDLSQNEAARAAFRPGEWNRYRIELVGPWLRTWIDGLPAADCMDPLDLEGFIGLQVHSGNDTKVHWRDLALWDLGTRKWEPVAELSSPGSGGQVVVGESGWSLMPGGAQDPCRVVLPEEHGDFSLRLRFAASEARLRVVFRSSSREPASDLEARSLSPGLAGTETGWVLEVDEELLLGAERAKRARPEQRGLLAVMAYGPRVAVNLHGVQVADVRAPAAARAGWIVLEARGPSGSAVELAAVELLGAPR